MSPRILSRLYQPRSRVLLPLWFLYEVPLFLVSFLFREWWYGFEKPCLCMWECELVWGCTKTLKKCSEFLFAGAHRGCNPIYWVNHDKFSVLSSSFCLLFIIVFAISKSLCRVWFWFLPAKVYLLRWLYFQQYFILQARIVMLN